MVMEYYIQPRNKLLGTLGNQMYNQSLNTGENVLSNELISGLRRVINLSAQVKWSLPIDLCNSMSLPYIWHAFTRLNLKFE